MRKAALLTAILMFTLVPAFTQNQKPENKGWDDLLPPGPGRDSVATTCVTCHGLKSVVLGRKSQAEWGKAVNDMIQRGAPVFPDEIEPMVQYLSKSFPANLPKPVNVNTATAADLEKIPGMKTDVAAKILEARGKSGPFTDSTDLQHAANIDKSDFESVRYLLKYAE
jgi:DNA uptake protein ComE-like DNA-binding protein